jgi:hypothetical protein
MAGLTVIAKLSEFRLKALFQFLTKCTSAGFAAERINLDLNILNPQTTICSPGKVNNLHICKGAFCAEKLAAELVKLAHAAGLRPLVAKHGPQIIKPGGQGAMELMFQKSPNHRSCALGPEGDLSASPICKIIHLLVHNICTLAHSPGKELCGFKNRCA